MFPPDLKFINWDVYPEFLSHPDPHYFRFADADPLQLINFADPDPPRCNYRVSELYSTRYLDNFYFLKMLTKCLN